MKLFLTFVLLFLVSSTSLFSQELSRTQKIEAIAELQEKIKTLQQGLLRPSEEDIQAANSRGLTAIRLLPRGAHDESSFERGGGAYYSFSTGSHSYNKTPQIELQQKEFSVGFYGASYGFMTDLGSRNINELAPFDEELNPSAENLARYFLEYLNTRVGDDRVRVYKVRCFETPTSVATYTIE